MTTQTPGNGWIREVNVEDFDAQVLSTSQQRPVLVDFWAQWCAPCLVIAPVLTELVESYAGRLSLAKVEVDVGENMKLAGRYQVRGFPTVILFRQGEDQGRFVGALPLSGVRDFGEQHGGI
jgi:thioredoxin 1